MPKIVTAFRLVAGSLVLAFGFLGCSGSTVQSENLAPNDIFQRYQVHYDAKDDATLVQGDFFQGSPSGVPLELTGRCQVTDNGKKLERPSDFAPLYKTKLEGLVEAHDFVFVHKDGTEEEHSIALIPIAPGPAPAPPPLPLADWLASQDGWRGNLLRGIDILRQQTEKVPGTATSYTFHWEGAPVGANESVYLIVENATGKIDLPATLNFFEDRAAGGRPRGRVTPPKDTNVESNSATAEVTRTAKYVEVTTAGGVGVTLDQKDLESIGEGNRTIKFLRVVRRKVDVREAGGERTRVALTATYMSERRPVIFEKRAEPKP